MTGRRPIDHGYRYRTAVNIRTPHFVGCPYVSALVLENAQRISIEKTLVKIPILMTSKGKAMPSNPSQLVN